MSVLKLVLAGIAVSSLLVAAGVASLIAFGTNSPPPNLPPASDSSHGTDHRSLPGIERYGARDGAELSFRRYASESGRVAFLIHGAAGTSADMHVMALALQASGVEVFVPDLRGHGANYPHGDVEYEGQLDDDLADFLQAVRISHPGARPTLIGFSSGGGFALRIAASSLGQAFDSYVLLSPFLRHDAPTVRKRGSSPADVAGRADDEAGMSTSTGRIVGLMILDSMGIHRFDGLPVLHFAVAQNDPGAASSYSWRMQESFQPHDDFRADIDSVSRPMTVFVGSEDERFLPEEFRKVFDAKRRDIPVVILPGLRHLDMATNAKAVESVVETVRAASRGSVATANVARTRH